MLRLLLAGRWKKFCPDIFVKIDLVGKLVWKADTGLTDGNIHHGVAAGKTCCPQPSSCRFAHLTFRQETKDVFPIFAFSSQGGASYEETTSLSQTPRKLSLVRPPSIFSLFISLYSMQGHNTTKDVVRMILLAYQVSWFYARAWLMLIGSAELQNVTDPADISV